MPLLPRFAIGLLCLLFALPAAAGSADTIAAASPRVLGAVDAVRAAIARIHDPRVRAATADALLNPATCVAHRVGLGPAEQRAVVDRLVAEGLADPEDARQFPGGLVAGLFPALPGDGGPCPHLPQPVMAAPGGNQGSHHAWPGGLMMHLAFNERSAIDFAAAYRRIDGAALPGDVPARRSAGGPGEVDNDTVTAPPLWHDWAKALVFVWGADGRLPPELALGGHGAEGDFRTGAHHILGLAETMSRHLPADLVLIQACAHHEPDRAHPRRLVDWLRAAAIIARIDPVAAGYLVADGAGGLTLPGQTGQTGHMGQGVPRWWPACLIHTQSDHNWVAAEPAARDADALLATLAPRFGVGMDDPAHYAWTYRHPILSHEGAQALQALAADGGLEAVALRLTRLRAQGVF